AKHHCIIVIPTAVPPGQVNDDTTCIPWMTPKAGPPAESLGLLQQSLLTQLSQLLGNGGNVHPQRGILVAHSGAGAALTNSIADAITPPKGTGPETTRPQINEVFYIDATYYGVPQPLQQQPKDKPLPFNVHVYDATVGWQGFQAVPG